ncbi:MAG: pilus assembly protein [Holosporaceae bacterium]|jgi:hypothetical protein|nr:pilus assembly protein [Holosporaceae bacterium]
MDFSKKYRGSVAIEAALTLPVICMLIFFIIEVAKLGNVQSAIDAIALEMCFDFMAAKKTDDFESIVLKHIPSYISPETITWYFSVYPDLDEMNSSSPFGGEEVYWPQSENSKKTDGYVNNDRQNGFLAETTSIQLNNYKHPETSFTSKDSVISSTASSNIGGKAFVLTVVCDYKFSSDFVKLLFGGGSNTVDGKNPKFLIWGRYVGVCS